MKIRLINILTIGSLALLMACNNSSKTEHTSTLYTNATIITADDDSVLTDADILVQDGRIVEIGKNIKSDGAEVVDFTGKTIIPALMSSHTHIGNIKGNDGNGDNFSRENVLRHLKKFEDYGVLWVQSMGTDRKPLYENGLYDSIRNGQLVGARMLSAGWGFGVLKGAPPFPNHSGDDNVFRPQSKDEVKGDMDILAKYPIDLVKVWVDDLGKGLDKMHEEIYKEIIDQAAVHNLKVAAHAYYLADAQKLVNDGVSIIGHSVRDTVIPDSFINVLKEKNIAYIPTLTLDEYSLIYGIEKPKWMTNPFFLNSLEPGVIDWMNEPNFQEEFIKTRNIPRNQNAFKIASANVYKLVNAGVLVGMGTDAGASPERTQGFSEHRELELLVKAGLTPLQALKLATINNAKILKLDKDYGSLSKGKYADFVVLDANPIDNISNTQRINSVYKAGKKVSEGPLKK